MKKLLSWLLCLALCVGVLCPAYAAAERDVHDAVGEVQNLIDGIVAFNLQQAEASSVQAWIDTALAEQAGVSAEWYVVGLSQSGDYDFSAYLEKLRAYLAENTVHSASSRQKYAFALAASGGDDRYIRQVMDESIGQQGIMSWVYGLHLLNNGYTSTAVTAEDAVNTLLSLQLTDGGWALTGEVADVDVTAMTVQALATHYNENDTVRHAVDQAIDLLSARQREDGGYASYGTPNPESTAQVLVALCAVGIDGLQDARFIKNGSTLLDGMAMYRLPDGSFSHVQGGAYNSTATVQAFFALVAYQRMLAGEPGLHVLDHRGAELQTDDAPIASKMMIGYKPITAGAIVVLALAVCVVLFLLKKRNRKNFAAVLVMAAVLIGVVFGTDFQSAESYYGGQPVVKENVVGTVTLAIRCDTVAGKTDAAYIPDDGVILDTTDFDIAAGDTVYTILTEAARTHQIQLENAGAQGMVYIAGIHYLYEFAFGDLSGWMYFVNGVSPSVGCDQYILSDGDVIEWLYTCELGNDLK